MEIDNNRMSKTLLIVESPGKIKKITSILGNGYLVMASVGHIRNLDSKTLSVDVDNGFEPNYVIIPDKKKVVRDLKNAIKTCKEVILAADEDREGEAIAASLAEVLNIKNPKRIVFNSITKTDIMNALKNPRTIDKQLVDAQKARVILDKIVGYRLCPLLWENIANKLSAGRVQSVVLRLIIDRENEINNHTSSNYFETVGYFKSKDGEIEMKSIMNKIDKKKTSSNVFSGSPAKHKTDKEIKKLLDMLTESTFKVYNIHDKKSERNPSAPFITSSLQQEASYKYGFSPKTTMSLAQKLYEGGHITYMRTDSTNLSKEALEACKKYIVKKYTDKYYRKKAYSNKSKNAQEAHEAIRPTHVENPTVSMGNDMAEKLYRLIWKRTVASQMSPAKINTKYIQIEVLHNKKQLDYYFETSIEKITFDGFLKVYNVSSKDESDDEEDTQANKIPTVGDILEKDKIISTEKYSRSIGRFTEASLVKELEKRGIGRPSTYASIITKIQDKEYVEKKDITGEKKKIKIITLDNEDDIKTQSKEIALGKEKNKLVPTHVGIEVTNYLLKNFEDIMDYKFTAGMEDDLDKIANGKLGWVDLLEEFYEPFNKKYTELKKDSGSSRNNGRLLGEHPETKDKLYAITTKFGHAIRIVTEDVKKADYMSVPKSYNIDEITLEEALSLFKTNKYPKDIGEHKGKMISLNKGRYGYWLEYDDNKYSLGAEDKYAKIKLDDAIVRIQYPKVLGKHNGERVRLNKSSKGDYYLSCGKTTCSLEEGDLDISLEEAIKKLDSKSKFNVKEVKIGNKVYEIKKGKGDYNDYISYVFNRGRKFVSIPKNINSKDITASEIKELIENGKTKKKWKKK